MNRCVFMTFDDLVKINTELLERVQCALYRSEKFDQPYTRVQQVDASAWGGTDNDRVDLQIGKAEDGERIVGPRRTDLKRQDRIGFVRVMYGGDDEDAIGATRYSGDASETEKLINRELNKLLKKYAQKGVARQGEQDSLWDNYYWTDAALESGKNWLHFLGHGVRKELNKQPCYHLKPEG